MRGGKIEADAVLVVVEPPAIRRLVFIGPRLRSRNIFLLLFTASSDACCSMQHDARHKTLTTQPRRCSDIPAPCSRR